jgi:cytochrome b561
MLRNTRSSWGLVSILFHWGMAALFFVQFVIGWTMQGRADRALQAELLAWHKSFGFLILGLVVARLVWSLLSPRPRLVETMRPEEKQVAIGTHVALLLGLIAAPLSGWIVVSTIPLATRSWFFGLFQIPNLPLALSLETQQIWSGLHGFIVYAMFFLTLFHMLAALRHHFQSKDETLRRMLWPH